MTKIDIILKYPTFSLKAEGHANYSNVGTDIVCASISTLMQYLIFTLSKENKDNFILETGFVEYETKIKSSQRVWINTFIECIISLQTQYPNNIKLNLNYE